MSLIIGSVPAVLVGSLLSSTAPDRYIRPAITFVIFASGLKYIGVETTLLGWILCAVLLASAGLWMFIRRPWERQPAGPPGALAGAPAEQPGELALAPAPLEEGIQQRAVP